MSAPQATLLAHLPEAALLTLLIFAALFALCTMLARRGKAFSLRPIPAYARLRQLMEEGIETGRTLHVSLGSGPWGSANLALMAGLTALDRIGQRAAEGAQTVSVTTGSPEALLLAMNLLPARGARGQCRLYGPDPLAYVSGAAAEGQRETRAAHALLGAYGDEGLWLAEALKADATPVIGGAQDPAAAALLSLSAEEAAIGEDLYAAGAYLGRRLHMGSLAAQDWMRLLVGVAVLAGAVLASLGIGG